MLLGLLTFLVGVYFAVVKAGIPYQDPPLELYERYMKDLVLGETLIKVGLAICFLNLVLY
ncbi:MAG TPA: hypothetical protein DGK91_12400 [Clostridium sp.]|nr:hypothetical protein [Clostridium sp.]